MDVSHCDGVAEILLGDEPRIILEDDMAPPHRRRRRPRRRGRRSRRNARSLACGGGWAVVGGGYRRAGGLLTPISFGIKVYRYTGDLKCQLKDAFTNGGSLPFMAVEKTRIIRTVCSSVDRLRPPRVGLRA